MIRFYFKLISPFFLLVAAAMGLIHTQPFDDHALRTYLMPDNCAMPCFMGIRPGETSYTQALSVLDAYHWLGQSEISTYSHLDDTGKIIQWSWNGSQPDTLKAVWTTQAFMMQEQGGVIIEIDVATNITLGDLWLMLGKPLQSDVNQVADMTLQSDHLYPKIGLQTEGRMLCPLSLDSFWRTPQMLTFFYTGEPLRSPNREDRSEFLQALRARYADCRN